MNRKWSYGIVALTIALAASVSAWAQPPAGRGPGGRGFGPGGHVQMLRGLDLTDAQRAELRQIMEAQQQAAAARNLRELQQQLNQAIFTDTPDVAKIDQLKQQIAAAETAALDARVETQLKIAQILTPEQRAKLREGRQRRAR